MTDPTMMSCEQFEAQLASYLSERWPEDEAERFEFHAAHCATCEAKLEYATRLSVPLVIDVTPSMRREVLAAVTLPAHGESTASRVVPIAGATHTPGRPLRSWRTAAAVLATAAALAVVIARRQPTARDGLVVTDTVAIADDSASPRTSQLMEQGSGMQQVAAQMASDQAKREFLELDAAAEELEAALEQTPTDRELRTFLNTVRARRDELTRRVREATS